MDPTIFVVAFRLLLLRSPFIVFNLQPCRMSDSNIVLKETKVAFRKILTFNSTKSSLAGSTDTQISTVPKQRRGLLQA